MAISFSSVGSNARMPTATASTNPRTGYTAPNLNYDITGNLPQTAAQENMAALPQLSAMAQYINALNQSQQQLANQGRIPGGAALEAASSANIGAGLAGRIDPGTVDQIGRWAAARGITSGAVGAPVNETAYLEAMGSSAYQRAQDAQKNLTAAYARNPSAPLYDVSQGFITPQAAGSLALQQAEAYAREELAKQELALRRDQIARAADATRGAGTGAGAMPRIGTTAPIAAAEYATPSYSYPRLGIPTVDNTWTGPVSAEQAVADQAANREWGTSYATPEWGYQPVSQGSMFIGNPEDYYGPQYPAT